MAETAKLPAKTDKGSALRPFESLRREIDRLFEDFAGGIWRSRFSRSSFEIEPRWRSLSTLGMMPAVDVAETDKGYEVQAELPGIDEKNVEVKITDGVLTIKGREAGGEGGKKRRTII